MSQVMLWLNMHDQNGVDNYDKYDRHHYKVDMLSSEEVQEHPYDWMKEYILLLIGVIYW